MSSSSSSSSYISSESSVPHHPHGGHASFAPFMLREFSDQEIDVLYSKYHPLLEGLSNEEKEDNLVELVTNREITVDQALVLSIREGLSE